MALPFFYIHGYDTLSKSIELNEETSKHIVQVLRMKGGELLNLTDGKGNLLTCEITEAGKKHCIVDVKEIISRQPSKRSISIAISLLKNTNRFEWFLEKATEIGVAEVIPLICERTEKEKFRHDRLNSICISAMLQSQQCWLPVLQDPRPFGDFVKNDFNGIRLIAHCEDTSRQRISEISKLPNLQIAIGPEGDFTHGEIGSAVKQQFIPVSLGDTRLRTETAGIAAAVLLAIS